MVSPIASILVTGLHELENKASWSNFQHNNYTDKVGYITAE